MNAKELNKLVEDIYTLTWDYCGFDPTNAEDLKCIIDTINYKINKFFKQNRVKIIWCEDEERNLYIKEGDKYREANRKS